MTAYQRIGAGEGHERLGRFASHALSYKSAWVAHYGLLPLLVAALVAALDDIPYLDALFFCYSSMCGAGLTTLSMNVLSNASIVIIGLLAMVGSSMFMVIAMAVSRKLIFQAVRQQVNDHYNMVLKKKGVTLSEDDLRVIADYEAFDDAMAVWIQVAVAYFILWIFLGIAFLTFALGAQPTSADVARRGFRNVDNAAFLSISAFANAGITIDSDSLMGYKTNPAVFLFLPLLIVAGNTAAPIFLRGFIRALITLENCRYARSIDSDSPQLRSRYYRSLLFLLEQPRRITTHLFGHMQTFYLARMVIIFVFVQYIFFIASTVSRKQATASNTWLELMGIGFFQTLSTRSAGFAMMDLRELSAGLMVVYLVMMYLSSFPQLAAMERSRVDPNSRGTGVRSGRQVEDYAPPLSVTVNPLAHSAMLSMMRSDAEADSMKSDVIFVSNNETAHGAFDAEHLSAMNEEFASKFVFRHTTFLLLAVIVCAYSEDRLLQPGDPAQINLFYIIFEITSAYGSVGLSAGVPGQSYSLSGALSAVGKVTMMIVMLLGKLRGLPANKDEVVDYSFDAYQRAWHFIPEETRKEKDSESSV